MAQTTVNIGNAANDGLGDNLRTAFSKINNNATEAETRFNDLELGGGGFKTVSDLLASAEPSRGVGAIWEAGGHRYEEVTTGQHVTTAAGVKLKVLPVVAGIYMAEAFGVPADGVTDATAAIRLAVGALAYGEALQFSAGAHKITDELSFTDLRGVILQGVSSGEFNASGTRFVSHNGTTEAILRLDYFKGGTIRDICFSGADNTTNRAKACILFNQVGLSGSNGPASIQDCKFYNAEFGVMLGDEAYANNYNVSEIVIQRCKFDTKFGIYSAGVSSGGQMVNNRAIDCHFGYNNCERAFWIDGGNIYAEGCTYNASGLNGDGRFVYVTGDVTLGSPSVFRDCYAEQIAKFLETEPNSTSGQFATEGRIVIENSWLRCNRTVAATAYLIECYKNLEIEVRNVVCTEGAVLYSPPADAAQSGYSATAPASRCLRFTGNNSISDTITTARGGYILSDDRAIRGTIPAGNIFPDTGTATLTIGAQIKNLTEYEMWAAYGSNGTFNIDTIAGGKAGDVMTLKGKPTQSTFRIPRVRHGVANIFLRTGVDYDLNTDAKKLVLEKDRDGNWLERARI